MTDAPDPTKLRERATTIGGTLRGANLAAAVNLGVRLGLYHALRDAGPLTSEQFSGFHERWLREWLYAQAAAGIVEYHRDGRFELPAESAPLLAEPSRLGSMEWAFGFIPSAEA